MPLNQKDQRIKKLYEKSLRAGKIPTTGELARKIGYGGAMEKGIKRVEEGLKRLGINK